MKQTKLIMGMPITVEIVDSDDVALLADVFAFFRSVDNRYSTYKVDSEMSRINRGLPKVLPPSKEPLKVMVFAA